MTELPWFRFYAKFITDPDVEELSFEDQRHFVFVLCLKCNGLLDKEFPSEEKRERAIARRLGLQGEAFTFAKERLIESGLVDQNWQPRSWDSLQFKSDSAAERMRKYRARKKELEPVTGSLRNSYVPEQIQNRTEQNTTAPSVPAREQVFEKNFEELKKTYPPRAGSQPWARAKKAVRARGKEDHPIADIIAGAKRYAAYCDATGKTGTEFVMQAATFCGPDLHFLQPWEPPPPSRDPRPSEADQRAVMWND